MARATRFTDPASVDAWDQWFRWRDAECLHDRTIDATWLRVANAIVPTDDAKASQWVDRYVDAFSRWQLLPDQRLLRNAGAGVFLELLEAPVAVLNVAAFVIAPCSRQARFDDERFADIAALAVRMLDDALVAAHGPDMPCTDLQIGLIGFADALHLLGIGYDTAHASECANTLGAVLHAGVVQGEMDLIEARGALGPPPDVLLERWRDRRVSEATIKHATTGRIRHCALTAIVPQPRLALLANRASDALDPHTMPGTNSSGRAMNAVTCACGSLEAEHRAAARRSILAAIQPWIDMPIATAESSSAHA